MQCAIFEHFKVVAGQTGDQAILIIHHNRMQNNFFHFLLKHEAAGLIILGRGGIGRLRRGRRRWRRGRARGLGRTRAGKSQQAR